MTPAPAGAGFYGENRLEGGTWIAAANQAT
jgi:hypothetical protein